MNIEQCVARNPNAGGRCQRTAEVMGRCVHHQGWVPPTLRLSCGCDVPHEVGTAIYNYYDMEAGTITARAERPQPDTSGQLPDGLAWWVDTTAGYLDGSRMCCPSFAARKGWA